MLTAMRNTKAAKITRTLDLSADPECGAIAIVTEFSELKTKTNIKTTLYHLRRIGSEIGGVGGVGGVAVEVHKHGPDEETYHVHLDRRTGDGCTCPGGTYKGTCRHLDMVREAVKLELV